MAGAAAAPDLLLYRIVTDGGWAPNISNGVLTLTICKKRIRKRAKVGDYVMALVALSGQKGTRKNNVDRLYNMAYLFQVEAKVPLEEYFDWCEREAPGKIPSAPNYMGNCQFARNMSYLPGPHTPEQVEEDKTGCYALVSRNFAAWTTGKARRITPEEREVLGLTDTRKLTTGMRNYFKEERLSAEKIAVLEGMMDERKNGRRGAKNEREAVPAPNKNKNCKAGKKKPKADGTYENNCS
jgi:hypothetical protein